MIVLCGDFCKILFLVSVCKVLNWVHVMSLCRHLLNSRQLAVHISDVQCPLSNPDMPVHAIMLSDYHILGVLVTLTPSLLSMLSC